MMHEKHRERLKQRFEHEGLQGFEEHNILELLLFFGVPRKDTNPLAHTLINRFGSLTRVIDAPIERLCEVKGMTRNAAVLLKLLPQVMSVYLRGKSDFKNMMINHRDCAEYLRAYFTGASDEMVYVVCLDGKCTPLECVFLCKGDINSVHVSPRKVMEIAFSRKASAILLAHNHPHGTALMSSDDINTTNNIMSVLESVSITLIDHLVFAADGEYCSFKDTGLLFK